MSFPAFAAQSTLPSASVDTKENVRGMASIISNKNLYPNRTLSVVGNEDPAISRVDHGHPVSVVQMKGERRQIEVLFQEREGLKDLHWPHILHVLVQHPMQVEYDHPRGTVLHLKRQWVK